MIVHGYECPECGFWHDRTRATKFDGKLQLKCADCGWREVMEVAQ